MLRFYWIPVVASRAFLFSPPDDSRSTMKQDRFSLCLNNWLLTRTQLSITDSMDTVKISQRFACANEIEVGLCAWLAVRCAPTLLPFPLSFKTLSRFSKASRLLVLYPWGEASIWEGREYRDFDRYRLFLSFASLGTEVRLGQRPTLYIII